MHLQVWQQRCITDHGFSQNILLNGQTWFGTPDSQAEMLLKSYNLIWNWHCMKNHYAMWNTKLNLFIVGLEDKSKYCFLFHSTCNKVNTTTSFTSHNSSVMMCTIICSRFMDKNWMTMKYIIHLNLECIQLIVRKISTRMGPTPVISNKFLHWHFTCRSNAVKR